MTETENKWTGEVEELLEKLRINCVNLSEYHRKRFYHYKGYGKYFRIPLILLASINSTASVGLQPVLEQQIISGITCLIGMYGNGCNVRNRIVSGNTAKYGTLPYAFQVLLHFGD